MARPRNICFVTGTRAEFGLMQRTLRSIDAHPKLNLQIVATGMHLDRSRGDSVREIRKAGFRVAATVPWSAPGDPAPASTATATGKAIAGLSAAFQKLQTDVVLVVGDRVEAFAAASAGHISGLAVAHVHGGDRALGQVDDSLRHAITKLSHLHFPATAASAARIRRLGEDAWRIHRVGSPGIDGIVKDAAPFEEVAADVGPYTPGRLALVAYHPVSDDEAVEHDRAQMLLSAVRRIGFEKVVVVYPNNDPGSAGIVRCWDQEATRAEQLKEDKRHPPSPGTPGVPTAGQGGSEGRTRNAGRGRHRSTNTVMNRRGASAPEDSELALTLTLSRSAARGDQGTPSTLTFRRNLSRSLYLGLLRDAAVLVGNSSSGIIEAASFGTPVVDVGPRQQGREHGANVVHVGYQRKAISEAMNAIWCNGRPKRFPRRNPYGSGNAAESIAETLSTMSLDERLIRKLIAY